MALMELHSDRLEPVRRVTFSEADVRERRDLRRLLRDRPELLLPDVLILAEEFGHCQDSRRRIDLLGVDCDGKLVVIELKRTEDGGHMELQALRYAVMVSTMTWRQAVDTDAVSNQWGTETQHALEQWAIAFSDAGIQVTAAGALA